MNDWAFIREDGACILLSIKLIPNAPRDEIIGPRANELLVKVKAPPVDGKANEALVLLLSKRFGIPRSAIVIRSGATSRHKVLELPGSVRGLLLGLLGEARC